MHRVAGYMPSCATYFSKRHGVAGNITTELTMQLPVVRKWGVCRNSRVHWGECTKIAHGRTG